MPTPLQQLTQAGVSIWLDDLSRDRLDSGNLQQLITDHQVTGVTTNPTIFAQALASGAAYQDQIRSLSTEQLDTEAMVEALTCEDVARAADLLRPVYESTGGVDGRVSIEVPPGLAHDTDATVQTAVRLWERIGRDNVLIKIPATEAGLPAITQTIARGVSVNVTLVFSLPRYRHVVEAYLSGLERARAAGLDISTIHSVASVFVSRIDSHIDAALDALDAPEAQQLKGRAGIANSRLAHQVQAELFSSERFKVLELAGAHPQRLLWASTGVKNPAYPDTLYVSELVAPDTVNTMPEATLQAFADHGQVSGDRVTGRYFEADQLFDRLAGLGIDYAQVMETLETEGLDKFDASWDELLATVRSLVEGTR